jgi:hypothetical protein
MKKSNINYLNWTHFEGDKKSILGGDLRIDLEKLIK